MANIFQKLKGGSQTAAKVVAKQIKDESNEILKTAAKQVTGIETGQNKEQQLKQQSASGQSQEKTPPNQAELLAKKKRLMEALENELAQIRQQEEQKEQILEQQTVQQSESVEEIRRQNAQVIMPESKKRRGMLGGVQKAKKGVMSQVSKLRGTSKAEHRKSSG